ncbi:helix-turn-helix transcriptional regulator [Marinilactibacillus sp. XAAS-LB27]|uniref:helix-turn-helix transcriptional regulator n=1 Tax=Marinilactibacillus sp. XAAS-LB27 TaxID=3114538 RepID=UPI002E189D22|nr:helix-turn-helix transcriptional regulator [Marinilactibacillus sp. XAAS-LB27]
MKLGNQIKKYRNKENLSQEELAERIYVSRQTISNWENERSYPDVHNLLLLSVLFSVSLDELVKGDVSKMKDEISRLNMDKYTKVMMFFIAMSMLSIGPSLYLPKYWFFVPPFILWAIGMYASIKVEKMKKAENIQTFREIIAFMEHRDIEEVRKTRNNVKDGLSKFFIVMAFLLVGVIIAVLSIFIFNF